MKGDNMNAAFVRFGRGCEQGSYGRCEAFDGFDVIAAPLGDFDAMARDSRVFTRASGNRVTYASHAIKLARGDRQGDLFILMQHGGGREVLRVPEFYDGGALVAAILAMPERLQYALLYSIWNTAANARREAQDQTRAEYAQAFVDGRLKKRRRNHRIFVDVLPASPALA
jgi:hypothetical protein